MGSGERTVALAQPGPASADDAKLAELGRIRKKGRAKSEEVRKLVEPLIRRQLAELGVLNGLHRLPARS